MGPPPSGQPAQRHPRGRTNVIALVVVWGLVAWVVFVGAVYLLTGDDDDDGSAAAQAGGEDEQPAATDQGGVAAGRGAESDPDALAGGDGGGAERQAYVDAFVPELGLDAELGAVTSTSDAECMAGAMIDAWGMPAVQAAGTPDQVASAPDTATLGLVMDRPWGNTVWDNLQACMDMRRLMEEMTLDDPTIPADVRVGISCMFTNLSDDDLRDVFVSFMIDEAVPRATQEAADEAALDCLSSSDLLPTLHTS